MLPVYTGEEIKKLQRGRHFIRCDKLFIFSNIFYDETLALKSGTLGRQRLLRPQETSHKDRQYHLCVVAIH
jgi:hypothetical protein